MSQSGITESFHPAPETPPPIDLISQADKDFADSLSFALAVPTEEVDSALTLIYLARERAKSNLDFNEPVLRARALAEQPGQIHQTMIYERLALLFSSVGWFETYDAELAKVNMDRNLDDSFYFTVAQNKARYGLDPSEELNFVKSRNREISQKLGGRVLIEADASLAAATYLATGVYPEEEFSLLEQEMERYERKYPQDNFVLHYKGALSRAFATCRNLERAVFWADNMQVKGDRPLDWIAVPIVAYRNLVQEQVLLRDYNGAIASGQKAISLLEWAMLQPEHLIANHEFFRALETPKFLALVAQSEALSGNSGLVTFDRAINLAKEIPSNGYWRSQALLWIIRAMNEAHVDSTPAINAALQELDAIPFSGVEAEGLSDELIDSMHKADGYEDIAKTLARIGKVDTARAVLGRIINLNEPFFNGGISEVYAEIGSACMKLTSPNRQRILPVDELG